MTITGTDGGETISGTGGSDLILGLGGNDKLRGTGGDDTLDGGAGRDVLIGGSGADTYVLGPDGFDDYDLLRDFSIPDGDTIDLRDLFAAYGMGASDVSSAISLTDTGNGFYLAVTVPGGTPRIIADVRGAMTEAELRAAIVAYDGPPPDTGDDDANLALTAPDTLIDATEVTAVAFTVFGLDVDATAVITVGDGTSTVTSGPVTADGTVVLDLSNLEDGPLTSIVTATDGANNATSVTGPALTLETAPDTTADEDGDLAIAVASDDIGSATVGAAGFTVSGLDADATAVITVGDGTNTVTSGPITANGTVTLDLSSLADGALTTTITATDEVPNTATVTGPALTLDTNEPTPEPGSIVGTAGGETISGTGGSDLILGLGGNDKLRGTGGDDTLDGGAGSDVLIGGSGADTYVLGPDGFDDYDLLRDFSIPDGDTIDLRDLFAAYGMGASDVSSAISLTDTGNGFYLAVTVPGGTPRIIADVRGAMTEAELRAAIVAYDGPPPDTGDDDANLALTAPDTLIDATEVTAVAFTVFGLDVDATAVITVGDGTNTVTSGPVTADGTVVLDLSNLEDGQLTSIVTATDGANNATSVTGPALTLETAPDTTADEGGDLAIAVASDDIGSATVGAAGFTVSGLDADATAVITVGDGTNTVTSGPITANGTVTLDLSSLADGALTTTITATDEVPNTATVTGPALTLDTNEPTPEPGSIVGTAGGETISGTGGSDLILGLGGNDKLRGTGGDDTLDGGAGSDVLIGGSGADTYVLGPDGFDDYDLLRDFSIPDGDTIDLRDLFAAYGMGASDVSSAISLTDTGNGFYLAVTVPGGTPRIIADVRGAMTEAELRAAIVAYDGPPPDTGDDDANLALTAPDTLIDATEVTAVAFTVFGLDVDATAVITVGDGTNTVTSGPVTADGTVVLDLSNLEDGQLTSIVTATDGANNATSVTGPALTLETAPDTTADEGGDLAIAVASDDIGSATVGAAGFTVSGLDADATAVITVGDGTNTVTSGPITANGTVTLDLSSLADGALTTTITATDEVPNTATITGPPLTLDTNSQFEISFEGITRGVTVNLETASYSFAASVLALGDSLTVGIVDDTNPNEIDETRDGYRLDLFEQIVDNGGWIDYVGAASNGPSQMLDTAHAAVSGRTLAKAVSDADNAGAVDISVALDSFAPDITLMMLGINDIKSDRGLSFMLGATLPQVVSDMQTAVAQFYDYADGNDAHLVISTLAPKTRGEPEPDFAIFMNEGYSLLSDGTPVIGDIGNGTHVAGIRGTIEELQQTHPTLLLFDNPHATYVEGEPVGTDHLSADEVHWVEEAYTEYAAEMFAFLDSNIGLSDGTFGGTGVAFTPTDNAIGGAGGDRITGNENDNVIDGAGGSDLLEGLGGSDTFVFSIDAIDGESFDRIADFNAGDGDKIDVSQISAYFGWDESIATSEFSLSESSYGVDLMVDVGSSTYRIADIHNLTLADISLANDFILTMDFV